MRSVLVYYAESTEYQFKTEPMIVFPEHEPAAGLSTALICDVPVGISKAQLVDMSLDFEGTLHTGTARVKYTYGDDSPLSHLIEYKLDCTQTRIHVRKKKK